MTGLDRGEAQHSRNNSVLLMCAHVLLLNRSSPGDYHIQEDVEQGGAAAAIIS